MLVPQGEGSGTPTESHHTPSPEAQQKSPTTHSLPTLPPVTTVNIPPVIPNAYIPTITPSDTPYLRKYTRRTRIGQSSVLPPVVDEHVSPLGDGSQGEACLTHFGFVADQDMANIAKTSTLPYESTSRVTSLAADEGTQGLEIKSLKARIKVLKDKDKGVAEQSRDDTPIKRRRLDVGEEAVKRVSDDTEEMATVLTSIDAATVLASGVVEVPTGSGSIPTAGPPATEVPTGSDVVPTAEQIDAQVARALEVKIAREDQRMSEQIARDAEIARIHAEEELQIMIDGLDRSNETQREFYTSVLRNHARWKAKHFKVMTLEEIKENFDPVWKQIHDFIPIGSKEEAKRFKWKGIRFEQESAKKLKTSEKVPEEVKSPDAAPEEKVKEMMQLVPIEKITRLGCCLASYQFFMDILKHLNKEDLNQLWRLVKVSLSIRPPTSDKEMELWVELKRLYEPDDEDQLVHHVTFKDKDIFMLVEKDYLLKKGLAIGMISYKLQGRIVRNKMHKAFPLPVLEFPLQEVVPTASEESSHCQKKRDATAVKIALLLKSRRNCQSKSYDSFAKDKDLFKSKDSQVVSKPGLFVLDSTLTTLAIEVRDLRAEFEEFSSNITNRVNVEIFICGPFKYPDDLDMPKLEDIVYSDDEEDVGAEVDLSNLVTNIHVSSIPTTRSHKDHPVNQIIGDLHSAPQTRSMTKMVKEQGGLHQINDEDFHTYMFACFLSQEEPKNVYPTLKDPSLIEAMQDELLQFKLQKVWVMADLPKGKRAIGLKWVFRNKKDEREILIKNKARLVAQGHTQEEGIDYDEVFSPVARIKAIQLFLAYASFMGFIVYQIDVKSAFLYETIEEEVYVCQPLKFEDPDDPDYPDKVYKVVKALYGLHQDPRAWKFGFTDVKSASTPIKIEKPLLKDLDGEDVDVHIYRDCITAVSYELMLFGLTKDAAVNLMLLVRKGFSGVETPLFASMLCSFTTSTRSYPYTHATPLQDQPSTPSTSPPQEQPTTTFESSMSLLTTLMKTYSTLSQKVDELEQDKHTQALEILMLNKRVKKLEKKKRSKSLGFKRLSKGRIDQEYVNAYSKGVNSVEPTIFDDEEVTMNMAQTLIKIKAKKSKLLDEQIAQKLHDEEVLKATARDKQEKDDMERAQEIHTEGSRTYWKIIKVSGITKAYQSSEDMLKGFDREDLVALWNLVKEKFSSTVPSVDKEKALWVELKRLKENALRINTAGSSITATGLRLMLGKVNTAAEVLKNLL
nr:hypothetical protein [Tanacetum cinerariifolium]